MVIRKLSYHEHSAVAKLLLANNKHPNNNTIGSRYNDSMMIVTMII